MPPGAQFAESPNHPECAQTIARRECEPHSSPHTKWKAVHLQYIQVHFLFFKHEVAVYWALLACVGVSGRWARVYLRKGHEVAGQTAHPLRTHRVAFVSHRTGPDLALAEGFL